VVVNKTGDKVVAVVVTRLKAQGQRVTCGQGGGFERIGLELVQA
jgi:hypothetical protein